MDALVEQTDIQLLYPYELAETTGINPVVGSFTLREALDAMFEGTAFSAGLTQGGTVTVSLKEHGAVREGNVQGKHVQRSLLAGISAFLFGAEAADLALAQDGDESPEAFAIDTIVVTASRREQSLQDAPMAVAVVQPDRFISAGLTSLQDVISYTPGFTFNTNGSGGQTVGRPKGSGSISARGVGQEGFGNTSSGVVGVYVDDVQIGNSTISFDGLLADIERVELLKGPQGTLYGATSVGGAIKYITRRPSLNEFRGRIAADLSFTENGGLNQIYSGRLSAPLVADRLGVTVAGYWEDDGGFTDRVDSTGVVTREDSDDYESFGVSGDVLFQINDRLDFRARVLHQELEYFDASFISLTDAGDGTTLVPRFGRYEHEDEGELPHITENTIYAGTFDYDFDWGSLTSTSSYVNFKHVRGLDVPAGTGTAAVVDFLLGLDPGSSTVELRQGGDTEKFVQEVRLTSTSGDRYEWLAGLYYTDETQDETVFLSAFTPDFLNLQDTREVVDSLEVAAFGNFTFYLTPDLDLTVGARVAYIDRDVTAEQSGTLVGAASPIESFDDTVDTYLFTLRYRPTEDLSLYARIASGYRPGRGVVPLSVPATGLETSSILESDTLWSYEGGVKGSVSDGLITYDLAAWYIDWDNFQTTLRPAPGISGAGNASGGVTSKGVEGSVVLSPYDGVSLSTAFAYVDSALSQDDPLLFGLKGQQLPYEPKWKVSANGSYEFALTPEIDAHVSLSARYIGEQRSAFEDANGFNPSRVNVPIDDYIVADLNIGFKAGVLSANVYVNNLLDEYALHSIRGLRRGNDAIDGRSPLLRPRTIGVVVAADF